MDDGIPSLGVGFELFVGDSIRELEMLQAVMNSTEARVAAEAAKIEKATAGMVNLTGATVQIETFSNASSRAARDAKREFDQIERSGEAMVRQLARQNEAFGLSRTELRQLRAEEAALAADRVKNFDLSGRLRQQATDLRSKEIAAVERAAAQERQAHDMVIAQLRERAQIEAALERNTGVGRIRASDAGATYHALAARAAEEEAKSLREAAFAYQMFEARARQGAQAMREAEAAQRASDQARQSAIGSAMAYAARLEAETLALGRNTTELRAMEAARRAAAADAANLPDEAARIRSAIAAYEKAEAGLRSEAAAAKRASDEHARLAAMVRGSNAAQEANATAAERMRMSTDPLYAATVRLNAEIAESTRLYHQGATAPAEYARQQQVLQQRLQQTTAVHNAATIGAGKNGYALTQLSFQLNDVATMAALGAPPMQIFVSQAGQIVQVAQMAEGGVKGLAASMGGFLLRFSPVIIALGAATAGLALFNREMSRGIDTSKMVDGLGLTKDEIKQLKNVSISTGDVVKATFQELAASVGLNMTKASKWFGEAMDWMTVAGRQYLAALYAQFTGTFRSIGVIVKGVFAGNSVSEILGDVKDAYTGAFDEADKSLQRFGNRVRARVADNKLADLKKQADALKEDRKAEKPKADRAAEQAAREAKAIEAQIAGLYRLADAYGLSAAEAMIAEARLKAETAAIQKRIDVEAAFGREIRLAVAERVKAGAESTAAMRDQAAIQEQVNAAVAAGTVPAEQAASLMRDRIADLPLLAAMEAARLANDVKGAAAAETALDKQRAARERLTAAEIKGQRLAAMAAGMDRLDELRLEAKLIGAADEVRVRALATLKAEQEARRANWTGPDADRWIKDQVSIADGQLKLTQAQADFNQQLSFTVDLFSALDESAVNAARGMADAFGTVGDSMGRALTTLTGYHAADARLRQERDQQIRVAGESEASILRENQIYAIRSASLQVGAFGDMASAAKGFFKEKSDGYRVMMTAEKAFRAIEFALSVRAVAQDAIETVQSIFNSGARAAASGAEGIANQSKLPFPLNMAAMAATAGALIAAGVAITGGFGGGKNDLPKANEGRGTMLGDAEAQSQSIKRALDALKEVDLLMLNTSREMAASLRSIERQIGGVASLVVRAGDVNANANVREGFKPDMIGSVLGSIPLIGGILGGLFGSKTTVVGSGIYGGAQSLGSVLGGGFDAQYYSDVEKQKRFLGIKTGKSYSTQYSGADAGIEAQFTMILREFNNAIVAAAGPLGAATEEIQRRLNGFVVNIGKIDLKGLTGEQVQEKLTAVFGAAADNMARTAFPGFERFQNVGEGLFETIVRVASTVETVSYSLDRLGMSTASLGIDAKVALAAQFESLGALSSATQSYFERFYTAQEQAAAQAGQFEKVFASLGLTLPSTLAGFRELVEAQNLSTEAGRSTYATLLQLSPAFADLQAAMNGARSAAEILSERMDLERKLLELQGETAKLRELDLAKLDTSNRALQLEIWALQDAQEAARQADELRKAWGSVGDSIETEIRRIRGLSEPGGDGSFASLMGQFNATTIAARGGDQDAAKLLPGLSQSLLRVAGLTATSRQELDRVQAQTAASLEQTLRLIATYSGEPAAARSTRDLLKAMDQSMPATARLTGQNDDQLAAKVLTLSEEIAGMRRDNNAGHAATAANTAGIKRKLEDVTSASGGEAVSVVGAAA